MDQAKHDAIKVAILLIPEFSQLVLTMTEELLRICGLVDDRSFETILCSVDGAAVTASNGRSTTVDAAMEDVLPVDAIIVCASYNPLGYLNPKVSNWLRGKSRRGAVMCGVDTGPFFLAEAGLLKDRNATLHWDDLQLARHRYPYVSFNSALFEKDAHILTSCGSLGTIDFVLELISMFLGQSVADKVRDITIHGRVGRDGVRANSPTFRAIQVMSDKRDGHRCPSLLSRGLRGFRNGNCHVCFRKSSEGRLPLNT